MSTDDELRAKAHALNEAHKNDRNNPALSREAVNVRQEDRITAALREAEARTWGEAAAIVDEGWRGGNAELIAIFEARARAAGLQQTPGGRAPASGPTSLPLSTDAPANVGGGDAGTMSKAQTGEAAGGPVATGRAGTLSPDGPPPRRETSGPETPPACPFCGGVRLRMTKEQRGPGYDGHLDDPDAFAYAVRCSSCGAFGGWAKSDSGAWRLWNMRSAAPPSETPPSAPPGPPAVLGCAHGRLPGQPCPHCLGVSGAPPGKLNAQGVPDLGFICQDEGCTRAHPHDAEVAPPCPCGDDGRPGHPIDRWCVGGKARAAQLLLAGAPPTTGEAAACGTCGGTGKVRRRGSGGVISDCQKCEGTGRRPGGTP